VSTTAQFEDATINADAFAAWAAVYDEQDNPLLCLEERMLRRILPDRKGNDVVDIGCGTGRWLTYLSQTGAGSLLGVDSSKEMLEIASAKQLTNVRFVHAELPSVPAESSSADLVIASFVLSYVADLESCASELARILRTGGDLFISDMHLETADALGWKRGFSHEGKTFRLRMKDRSIAELIDAIASKGFSLVGYLEPGFGEPERQLFRQHGKDMAWDAADGRPAIYLLQFRRSPCSHDVPSTFTLHGAQCALGPVEFVSASVGVSGGSISSILGAARSLFRDARESLHVDLDGYLLLPGLVNAHDHLEFALFPRLGSGPYKNATEWATDIQSSEAETIALHKRVPKAVRLWWGGIRNLLCGVTTVCHHNPLYPSLRRKDFPVRVVQEYGWEHSFAFGADIAEAIRGTSSEKPFLVHAGEGINSEAFEEVADLDAIGALQSRTVLVHGLAMDQAGATLLNDRGSALIICPSSNQFLFQKTHTVEQLQGIHRLALGSDSPLTADGDLLDELRFARRVCQVPVERLYEMVTAQAAQILRLRQGQGALRIGSNADLIAIRHRAGDPSEILSTLAWHDVELVVVGGRVKLASDEMIRRLPLRAKQGLAALNIEGQLRWLRGPVLTQLQLAERVLGVGNVRVGGLKIARAEL
jgi:cytosine/adenosine deaminase-related metal-dependent hydrolase/ubiquinone/menaquinone biosynthesis C-methylase UbiE